MADITMCDDRDCPLRKKCYRFIAIPSKYRQSYFVESPREKDNNKCDYYSPVKEKK